MIQQRKLVSFVRCLFGTFQIFGLPVQQTWDVDKSTDATDLIPISSHWEYVGEKIGINLIFRIGEMKVWVEGQCFLFVGFFRGVPKKVANFLWFWLTLTQCETVRTWSVTSRSLMAFGNCAGPARRVIGSLGGGFKYFLFSPLLGDMIQFDYYFSSGLKPPTSPHWHGLLRLCMKQVHFNEVQSLDDVYCARGKVVKVSIERWRIYHFT